MAYTPLAAALRRCTATRRDGTRCAAWALWGDPGRRCRMHAPPERQPRGRQYTRLGKPRVRRRPPSCRCRAYAWPHRPGSGGSAWPLDADSARPVHDDAVA